MVVVPLCGRERTIHVTRRMSVVARRPESRSRGDRHTPRVHHVRGHDPPRRRRQARIAPRDGRTRDQRVGPCRGPIRARYRSRRRAVEPGDDGVAGTEDMGRNGARQHAVVPDSVAGHDGGRVRTSAPDGHNERPTCVGPNARAARWHALRAIGDRRPRDRCRRRCRTGRIARDFVIAPSSASFSVVAIVPGRRSHSSRDVGVGTLPSGLRRSRHVATTSPLDPSRSTRYSSLPFSWADMVPWTP